MLLDLELMSKNMDSIKKSLEAENRNKRKKLFWDIVMRWEIEQDIDYTVPVSTLIKVLVESPSYIHEMKVHTDCLQELSGNIDNCAYAASIPRLL
ncbi:hypothetical protein QMP26_41835 (plasmid) [Enterocloster clostridioformis]